MFPWRQAQGTCLPSGTVSAQRGFRRAGQSWSYYSSESRGYMSEITFDFQHPGGTVCLLLTPHTLASLLASLPGIYKSSGLLTDRHILCRAAEFSNWAPQGCACRNRSSNQPYWLNGKTSQKGDCDLRLKTRWQDTQSIPSLICEASPSMSRKKKSRWGS